MQPDDIMFWQEVFPATTELGRRLVDLAIPRKSTCEAQHDREPSRETAQNEERLAEWLWEST